MISENKLRHMLGVARRCRDEAEAAGATQDVCDAAFVMGLLHDMGYEKLEDKQHISAHPAKSAKMLDNALPYILDIRNAIAMHGRSECNDFWSYILNKSDLSTDYDGSEIDPSKRIDNLRSRYGAAHDHTTNAVLQYNRLSARSTNGLPEPPKEKAQCWDYCAATCRVTEDYQSLVNVRDRHAFTEKLQGQLQAVTGKQMLVTAIRATGITPDGSLCLQADGIQEGGSVI